MIKLSIASGTHRKRPVVVAVAAAAPLPAAVDEIEAPGSGETLCFTRPNPPAGGLQQGGHIPIAFSSFVQCF